MNWPKNNNNNTATTKTLPASNTHYSNFTTILRFDKLQSNLYEFALLPTELGLVQLIFILILFIFYIAYFVRYKFYSNSNSYFFSLDQLGASHHWPTYYECHPVIIQHFQFNFAFNFVNFWQLNFITPSLFITLETEGQVEDSTPFTLSYTANIIHHTCKAYRKPS